MNPADSLFEAHRVPRKVIVDDFIAKLKVDSFAACFSRDQNLHFAPEQIFHPVFLSSFKSASERYGTDAVLLEEPLQINLRRPVLR